MKFEIRDMSWFKRRAPVPEPKPVDVEIRGLCDLVDNSMCVMDATYDNGETYVLQARVLQNEITGKWTVHGLDHLGHSVLVDIVE